MNLNWPTSKAIHTVEIEQVKNSLDAINLSQQKLSVIDKPALLAELSTQTANLKKWLSDFLDLSEFKYAYAVNGVTDAINHWVIKDKRLTQRLCGDYRWIDRICPDIKIINNIEEIDPSKKLYVSNPFSMTGSFLPIWEDILRSDAPIALDCAFLGSVRHQQVPLNQNVESVFFSFSKGFGLGRFRAGWYFSREPVAGLETLHEVAYYPALTTLITQLITSQFSIHSMYNLFKGHQAEICKLLDLQPSDSYLIGLSSQASHPDWVREDGLTSRIPLAHFYNQMKLTGDLRF